MEYSPVSILNDTLPAKSRPLYATRFIFRKPEVKYQQAGPAKSAIRYNIGTFDPDGRRKVARNMYLYKFNVISDRYELIWDSESELADACRRGDITPDELMDRIAW